MNILVTGGAGFIGSHTLIELYKAGHTALVVDNLYNAKAEALHRVEEILNSQSPITNQQSPITNQQSAITNHQSPITNHQSPITNHQSTSLSYRLTSVTEKHWKISSVKMKKS